VLLLTRKESASIFILDDITLIITRINDGTALVGIDAPNDIPVHREEVYYRIAETEKDKQLEP